MDRQGVALDQYSVSILMKASRRAKNSQDSERALAVLDRIGSLNVCEDEVLFNTVLDACINRRDRTRLSHALESYAGSKMRASVRTYGLLIKAGSLLKRISFCWDLWTEMTQQRNLAPNDITLPCMLDAVIENRNIEDAFTLFKEWKTKVVYNTVIYSTRIKGFASVGDAERAITVYHEAQTVTVF
jgi:pentatricopeptide repeat protein